MSFVGSLCQKNMAFLFLGWVEGFLLPREEALWSYSILLGQKVQPGGPTTYYTKYVLKKKKKKTPRV